MTNKNENRMENQNFKRYCILYAIAATSLAIIAIGVVVVVKIIVKYA